MVFIDWDGKMEVFKPIPKLVEEVFNIGVIGHNVAQVTNQKGGETPVLLKHRLNGLGLEMGYRTKNKWIFTTRWYLEYLAKNRPEGTAIRFVLLKNF